MSLATAILTTAIVFIALAVANAVALDLLGLPIHPWVVLVATVVELAAAMAYLWRRGAVQIDAQYDELLAFLLLVAIVTAYLIYPSLPALFPPARHFDAVNHALLADYIFEHNALPHDFSTNARPYHLSGYPTGGALFGALVAHWTGNIALKTIHPVISLILGLAAGLVFVLLKRLLPQGTLSTPIAFLTTMLLFTAWDYFPGSVNERYFYAQIFSQFFALSAFLFAFFYWVAPDLLSLILMAMSIGTILLSHPTPIVAPTLAAFAAIGLRHGLALRRKAAHALILASGILVYVLAYALPHLVHWVALTGLGEAVPLSFDSIGYFLPTLSALGFVLAWRRHWRDVFRFPILLLLTVLAQPVALYLARFLIPNITGYYFEKSLYLLIYPLALLAALPLAELASRLQSRLAPKLAWGAVLALGAIILLAYPPRPFAPMTESEFALATWAKQNLDVNNMGIVSSIREDAYWIQVAVFQQPLSTASAVRAYNLGAMTFEEWRGNPGKPDYALVRNLSRVPKDPTVQMIHQIGQSGIVLKPPADIAVPPSPQRKTQLRFADMFHLVGYDASDQPTQGSLFEITFYWLPLQWPANRISMFVQLLDPLGNVVTRSENEMFQKKFPTQRWPIGIVTKDVWRLSLDQDTLPGDYTIQVAVFDTLSGSRLAVSPAGPEQVDEIRLGPFRVTVPSPSADELHASQTLNAQFADSIALRAYTIDPASVHPGDSLRVTLYWQSLASVPQDYTVFVHLLDSSSRVRTQIDSPPQNGMYPTSAWKVNTIIKDPYRLAIPKDTPPGIYAIEIGLYTPSDLKRVLVAGDDHIVLAQTITVK